MRLLIRAAAPWALTLLLEAAIMLGFGLGAALPMFGQALGAGVNVTRLTLMCLLLVEVRAAQLLQQRQLTVSPACMHRQLRSGAPCWALWWRGCFSRVSRCCSPVC